jgi:hypothetical protein
VGPLLFGTLMGLCEYTAYPSAPYLVAAGMAYWAYWRCSDLQRLSSAAAGARGDLSGGGGHTGATTETGMSVIAALDELSVHPDLESDRLLPGGSL